MRCTRPLLLLDLVLVLDGGNLCEREECGELRRD
jgi:hypothetical protein